MNEVMFKGRITANPELKYTQTANTAVCSFSVAVNRKFKSEGQPDVDFFNITTWGKTAEFVSKYFTKGQEILVEGHLQQRTWETESGEKRYATDIVAEQVEFCGSKSNSSSEETTVNAVELNGADVNVVAADDDLPF